MPKLKDKKNRGWIIFIECIIIAIIVGFIAYNFISKDEPEEEKNSKYLTGRQYIKDICPNTEKCNTQIGPILLGDTTYNLQLDISEKTSIIKVNNQEIYNVDNTEIDYIEIINDKYLLVHQLQNNGTYHTDLYNKQFNNFFHILSRKIKNKDTDMYVENNILYYYDYNCSNTDKRYATKFSINLEEEVNAPILIEETYDDDYMPNCA